MTSSQHILVFGIKLHQNNMNNEPAKGGTNKEGKLDELGMSSPKRRLMDAKEQAAYFEREVRNMTCS